MYELIPEYEESDLRNDFTFSKGRLSVLGPHYRIYLISWQRP